MKRIHVKNGTCLPAGTTLVSWLHKTRGLPFEQAHQVTTPNRLIPTTPGKEDAHERRIANRTG